MRVGVGGRGILEIGRGRETETEIGREIGTGRGRGREIGDIIESLMVCLLFVAWIELMVV